MSKKALITSKIHALKMTINKILKKEDFEEIYEYEDGMSAVNAYIKLNPDIVISDENLSDITGLELFQQIQIKDKNARFIILGERANQNINRIVELGGKFLQKPIEVTKLSRLINEFDTISQKQEFSRTVIVVTRLINVRYQIKKLCDRLGFKIEELDNGNLVFDKLNLKNYNGIIYENDNDYLKGEKFLKQFRIKGKESPVIMLTNNNSRREADSLIRLGAKNVLLIPINLKTLENEINSW